MMKDHISDSARDTIGSILDWIKCNLSESLTTKTLSEKSGYSLWYFQRCFKIVTGVTPMTYINFLRMQLAKKFLEKPEITLTQIAMNLGYSQQSSFCRKFKNYYRLTPKEFRCKLLTDNFYKNNEIKNR